MQCEHMINFTGKSQTFHWITLLELLPAVHTYNILAVTVKLFISSFLVGLHDTSVLFQTFLEDFNLHDICYIVLGV